MLKLFLVIQFIGVCFAFPGYRSRIPNGMNVPNPCPNTSGVWKGVGHNVEGGGGPRNVFGIAFLEAKKVWTKELCQADSDTDGKTNGEELGDPNCTWTEGSPVPGNATGHPGVCEPMSDEKFYCFASPGFRLLIPNGINVPNPCPNSFGLWNGVGHNVEVGGGAPNVFGAAFKEANKVWTKELCQADSDTDGKTNGQELGDPNCTWKQGMPYPGDATGHPGVCEPMSDAKCKDINKDIQCASFPEIYLP